MAQKSGFYPSNRELGIVREYSGYDFGKVLNHVITDGVFATPEGTPSNYLQVVASEGLTVNVLPGAGRFGGQWYENDANIPITLVGENSLNRIDLIVVEANKSPDVLNTFVKVIQGIPATVPTTPSIVNSDLVKQYPLAKIEITAGVATITQSAIEDLRGVAPTLWVTGLIQQLDTSTLWKQFSTKFNEWFSNVKDTLSTVTLMRKYTGHTYSVSADQTEFQVPIVQYNSVLDLLQVHVEGRILREGVDYVKNGVSSITLTTGLPVVGTLVYFEIFKSVDGTDAENMAGLLTTLEGVVNRTKITADDGSYKLVITNNIGTEVLQAGIGFHTLYIPNTVPNMPVAGKSWMGFVNFVSLNNGYITIFSQDGDVYTIEYKNGAWTPWRAIYSHTVTRLYTSSGNMLGNSTVTTLSKALSNCKNGWVLHFAKYGSLDDMNFAYHLPKVRYDGSKWSGQAICIEMPYEFSSDGSTRNTCLKKLFVSDNSITGFTGNGLGVNANMVLVGITEY